jgi:hypothetical protein
MTIARALMSLLILSASSACGGGSPSTPPPAGGDTITGSERFGWDQPAADAGELATFRYAIYVDDVRSEVTDAQCAPAQTPRQFACTCSLPSMTSGPHTVQVSAYVLDGGTVRESSRSTPVRVVKQ